MSNDAIKHMVEGAIKQFLDQKMSQKKSKKAPFEIDIEAES